jgi:hypothetical protein
MAGPPLEGDVTTASHEATTEPKADTVRARLTEQQAP